MKAFISTNPNQRQFAYKYVNRKWASSIIDLYYKSIWDTLIVYADVVHNGEIINYKVSVAHVALWIKTIFYRICLQRFFVGNTRKEIRRRLWQLVLSLTNLSNKPKVIYHQCASDYFLVIQCRHPINLFLLFSLSFFVFRMFIGKRPKSIIHQMAIDI